MTFTTANTAHLRNRPGVVTQPYAGISRHGETAEVWLPGMKLKNPLNNLKGWREIGRGRKLIRQRTAAAFRLEHGASRFVKPLRITITRVIAGRLRLMDKDGLYAAAKSVRDGTADWLLIDDAERFGTEWEVYQERGPTPGVRVRVEPDNQTKGAT
jgi:hypothetical protein